MLVTSAIDGTPNVVHVSHVFLIDPLHVAISNQFLGKTVVNLRTNPVAMALCVDPATLDSYRLLLRHLRSESGGNTFDMVQRTIEAVARLTGMAEVFGRARWRCSGSSMSKRSSVGEPLRRHDHTDGRPHRAHRVGRDWLASMGWRRWSMRRSTPLSTSFIIATLCCSSVIRRRSGWSPTPAVATTQQAWAPRSCSVRASSGPLRRAAGRCGSATCSGCSPTCALRNDARLPGSRGLRRCCPVCRRRAASSPRRWS